jgi:hypothetical protein
MPRNLLSHRALLVYVALVLAGGLARADDKGDKPTLSGTWEKKDAEPTLEFSADDKLTIRPHGDNLDLEIECSYTVTKDGLIKAKVKSIDGPEKVVEQVKGLVPIGFEFQFKWKVEKSAATLDAMEGKDVDPLKARLEGEYAKKP